MNWIFQIQMVQVFQLQMFQDFQKNYMLHPQTQGVFKREWLVNPI